MIIKPKFIKKANQWLVHEITVGQDKKQVQKMNWFETEDEAKEFINLKEKK